MIIFKKTTKFFGKSQVLINIDLQIEKGDLYGLLGPNGAGKTTLINIISGLITPSSGQIIIKNSSDNSKDNSPLIGVLFENPSFYEYLTGKENITLLARLKGCYKKKEIIDLLNLVSLSDETNKPLRKYSLGMKQRLAFACALLGNPDILLLDEPTNGLDPEGIQTFLLILKELTTVNKKTVIISSHQVHDIESICNKIAIINKGIILRSGNLNDLLKKETHSFLITTANPDELKNSIKKNPFVKDFEPINYNRELKEFYFETLKNVRNDK